MRSVAALAGVLVCGCTTTVSHPAKTQQEMRADIDLCTDSATTIFWYDAVAALVEAYDCLEAKGYKRTTVGWAEEVEKAMGQKGGAKSGPNQPCVVPCRR